MLNSEHKEEMLEAKRVKLRAVRDALEDAETVFDDRVAKLKERLKRKREPEVKSENVAPKCETQKLPGATPPPPVVQNTSGPMMMMQQMQQYKLFQQMQQMSAMSALTPRRGNFSMMQQNCFPFGSASFS